MRLPVLIFGLLIGLVDAYSLYFINATSPIIVEEGQPLTLTCALNCNKIPPSHYIYYKLPNGTLTERRSVDNCSFLYTFETSAKKDGDGGNYTCKLMKEQNIYVNSITMSVIVFTRTDYASLAIAGGILLFLSIPPILICYFVRPSKTEYIAMRSLHRPREFKPQVLDSPEQELCPIPPTQPEEDEENECSSPSTSLTSVQEPNAESPYTGNSSIPLDDLCSSKQFELHKKGIKRLDGVNLGSGEFGEVKEGRLTLFSEWKWGYLKCTTRKKLSVAVKTPILKGTYQQSKEARELWDNELKRFCDIGSHPNIVNLYGAVTINERWLVVEKCEKDLESYLKNKRNGFVPQYSERGEAPTYLESWHRLDHNGNIATDLELATDYWRPLDDKQWKKALESGVTTSHLISFGIQIAQGLRHLGKSECVHRDIAARNVLLTATGICKISDFGFSKQHCGEGIYRCKTNRPLPDRWMAPEAFEEASVLSDIWSYGIVLFELFSLGEMPYDNGETIKHAEQLKEQIKSGKRCRKPAYCPSIIYDHMKKCWNINPQERPNFQTAIILLKLQLSISSKELLHQMDAELAKEEGLQRKIVSLRQPSAKYLNLENGYRYVWRAQNNYKKPSFPENV